MKVGCIGELVADFISVAPARSIKESSHFQMCPGGSPANVAATLQQDGFEVSLISRVGVDGIGEFVREAVSRKGLSLHHVGVDPDFPTRCVFIGYDTEGRRCIEIANRDSADQHMDRAHIAPSLLDELDVLHVGGTTVLGEFTGKTVHWLIEQVKKRGGLISFDPNINLRRISDPVKGRILHLLQFVDILKTNADEWKALQDILLPKPAGQPVLSVCTKGSEGATIISEKHTIEAAARPVVVRDPTGAGDAFFAGFLGFLLQHAQDPLNASRTVLERSGAAGSERASRVIQHVGGALAAPD